MCFLPQPRLKIHCHPMAKGCSNQSLPLMAGSIRPLSQGSGRYHDFSWHRRYQCNFLCKFANDEEYKNTRNSGDTLLTVFPYAKEAIRIFRRQNMHRNTYLKRNVRSDSRAWWTADRRVWRTPQGLTKLQGKIMIKMIERTQSEYAMILSRGKEALQLFTGTTSANSTATTSKRVIMLVITPILDAVLNDFDVSYRIENESSLKYYNLSELRKK